MALKPAWLLRMAGSALILAILARMIDWRVFTRAIVGVNVYAIIVACCFIAGVHVLLGVRWAIIGQGASNRGFWRQICLFWQAGLLNQVTPAALGGDVYRVAIMRLEDTALSFATGAVVFERALGLAGFAAIYLILYALAWQSLPLSLSAYAAGAAIMFGCVIFGFVVAVQLVRLMRRWLPRPVSQFLSGMNAVIRVQSSARLAMIGLTTLMSACFWVIAVVIVSGSLGLKISVPLTGMITILAEFSRWIPLSVQGIGVREGVFVFFAQRLDENMGSAFAVILVAYVLNSLIVLALGLLAMLLGDRRKNSLLEST
jgi:uncharacterized protein (TIRG00374 family)